MWSDVDSRDDDVDRGPIPLDIDNVHLLLQGASSSLPPPDTRRATWGATPRGGGGGVSLCN